MVRVLQRREIMCFCSENAVWAIYERFTELYQPAKKSVSSEDFNLILIHLRKPTCALMAGLSLFLQYIKTVFLAVVRSARRTSELHGLLSPFTAFLCPCLTQIPSSGGPFLMHQND